MEKYRESYFDNARIILSFLVVLGHMISPGRGGDHNFLTNIDSIIASRAVLSLLTMPAFFHSCLFFSPTFKR